MQLYNAPCDDIGSCNYKNTTTINSSNFKLFKFIAITSLLQGLLLIFLQVLFADNTGSTNATTSEETSFLRKFNIFIEHSKNKTKGFTDKKSNSTRYRIKPKNNSNGISNHSNIETKNKTTVLVNGSKLSISNCKKNKKIDERHMNLAHLRSEFSCRNNDNIIQPKTINFLSCAAGIKYENVLPMYTFYALSSHNNSIAEIVVSNELDFIVRNKNALIWLKSWLKSKDNNNSFCIRNFALNHKARTIVTNTWRFLEVPKVYANYTYIGDIDIFLTESVFTDNFRINQMRFFDMPYSNVLRPPPNDKRLTGLILIDTKNYYTPKLINAQRVVDAQGNDEVFLRNLVVSAGFNLPYKKGGSDNKTISYYSNHRPQHGEHLSLSRGPGKGLCQTSLQRITDKMLSVYPNIGEYLCNDDYAMSYLSKVVSDSYQQEKYHMTLRDVGGGKKQCLAP